MMGLFYGCLMFRSKVFWFAFASVGFLALAQQVPFAFFKANPDTIKTYPDLRGLVARWPLDEMSVSNTTVLADASGGHDAVMSSDNGSAEKSITGFLKKAIRFDGVNDVAQAPGNSVFDVGTTSDYTMMAWVNRQGTWNDKCFLANEIDPTNGIFCLLAYSDTQVGLWDGNNYWYAAPAGGITVGVWNHLAVSVSNRTNIRIFWNGSLLTSTTSGTIASYTNYGMMIGGDNWDTYVHADIDEVTYWNRALSDSEIQTIYANQSPLTNITTMVQLRVFNIGTDQFEVKVKTSGDRNKNATGTVYYCSHTDSADCDPLSGASAPLSRQGGYLVASLSGLTSPYDPGDELNIAVVGSDVDGLVGSPISDRMRLDPSPVKAIFRSVAAGATAALETGSVANTLTVSGSTATFSASVASHIGVGDVIQYDPVSDSTTPSQVAIISGRASSTSFTVLTSTGGTATAATSRQNWKIFRAYTSLFNAEARTENTGIDAAVRDFDTGATRDLVTNNESYSFAVYGNGTTADSTAVTIAGWTLDQDHMIRVYAPSDSSEVGVSQRHTGVWDTSKYYLQAAVNYGGPLTLNDSNIWIDGLQIDNSFTGDAGSGIVVGSSEAMTAKITGNLITSSGSGTIQFYASGIFIANQPLAGSTFYIYNNIIYKMRGSGINLDNIPANTHVYVYNNTIYGNQQYGMTVAVYETTSSVTAYNNIFYGSVSQVDLQLYGSSTGDVIVDKNLTEDTSGTQAVLTFANTASNNFKLSAADTAAMNFGKDFSSPLIESDFSFETDVELGSRLGQNWDIGADQY